MAAEAEEPSLPPAGTEPPPRRQRPRWRSPLGLIAGGLLLAAALVLSAALQGEIPEAIGGGTDWVRHALHGSGRLTPFGLLYIEESGIPLPAPGDVFVMYVGAHVPHGAPFLLAAWLGLILAVVLGATNLYLVARRLGRGIADSRVARFAHLTPERLDRAEGWFDRYGVLAIIFGRHIPGFRVPITVAAGVFQVPYRKFALSVAASSAIWAGAFLAIGVVYGGRFEAFIRLHRGTYWLLGAVVLVAIGLYTAQRVRALRGQGPSDRYSDKV